MCNNTLQMWNINIYTDNVCVLLKIKDVTLFSHLNKYPHNFSHLLKIPSIWMTSCLSNWNIKWYFVLQINVNGMHEMESFTFIELGEQLINRETDGTWASVQRNFAHFQCYSKIKENIQIDPIFHGKCGSINFLVNVQMIYRQ